MINLNLLRGLFKHSLYLEISTIGKDTFRLILPGILPTSKFLESRCGFYCTVEQNCQKVKFRKQQYFNGRCLVS